jgi:pimeloyl-ACP methyl ester carboxylesterase
MNEPDRSRWLSVNGLDLHLREWGAHDAPRLFLLHGWMDVSASFAFMVDELQRDWHVIAPDWRGFGLSSWAAHGYEFPDYFADLDALLERLSPDEPARVVGHSMGGNVLMAYSGLRPDRLSRIVSLEGFGGHRYDARRAPAHFVRWLDQQRKPASFRPYASLDDVARRLRKNNPRLTAARAAFLAPRRPAAQTAARPADPARRGLRLLAADHLPGALGDGRHAWQPGLPRRDARTVRPALRCRTRPAPGDPRRLRPHAAPRPAGRSRPSGRIISGLKSGSETIFLVFGKIVSDPDSLARVRKNRL